MDILAAAQAADCVAVQHCMVDGMRLRIIFVGGSWAGWHVFFIISGRSLGASQATGVDMERGWKPESATPLKSAPPSR